MTGVDQRYLGYQGLPEAPDFELAHFFTLSDTVRAAIQEHRRPLNRLGSAIQLGWLRMTGLPMDMVEMIAPEILAHVGADLGIAAPRLASLRAIYRRRRTLFEHQVVAKTLLGLRDVPDHGERTLVAFLRREAAETIAIDDLVTSARVWLADHLYLQLPLRRLKRLATAARDHRDKAILARAIKCVGKPQVAGWADALLEVMDNGATRMDWLREAAASRKPRGLADHVAKIVFLKALGADRLDLSLSTALLKELARPMLYRKPATVRRMRGSRKLLEIACFLRRQLMRMSDDGLGMIDFRIADLWRQARGRVELKLAGDLRRHQQLVASLMGIAEDEAAPAEGARRQMRALLVPFVADSGPGLATLVARVRRELANDTAKAQELLLAAAVGIDLAPTHPLKIALATLAVADTSGTRALSPGTANPFGASWAAIIDQGDRQAALDGYRAATLMLLKRSLRNGQASVSHSLEHRAPEERLIPLDRWMIERGRFVRQMGLSAKPEAMLRVLKTELQAALTALQAAVESGIVRIKDNRLIVPKLQPVEEEKAISVTRRALFARIGPIELPDLLVETDAATRFSWTLLGRPPKSEEELIALYAAIIALGSDLTAADVARMTLGITDDAIGAMMMRIEAGGRLRATNILILDTLRALPITRLWGNGLNASADMMSLDATRYHWSARSDPRRQAPAIGTYTHILDSWPILHDMPIILNKRQAGAAIEGALRHEAIELDRVAVDTHGFTHFAMGLAKLLGFDLCPRLAHLGDRKLYLPRGLDVPESLRGIVRETVSTRAITKGWDPLLRIAASTKSGWCSATYILDRFGSAAHGDIAFQAGDALGKLLRTRYLARYLSDQDFRTHIHALLNQGEAVHTLQRAIHHGPIGARRGRSLEQMTAISSCLALLTNIVMTWNATKMQAVRDSAPETYPETHMRRIAPITHGHINMRGRMNFDLSPHRARLLNLFATEISQKLNIVV